MPVHDWRRVNAGMFHDFHQAWTITIRNALNAALPPGFSALAEQFAGDVVPDVLTVERRREPRRPPRGGGVALAEPTGLMTFRAQADAYADRANRIVVRHRLGDVVAALEIVSPGNKSGAKRFRRFLDKTVEFVENGVNVAVVDLFPPGPRDPEGVHAAVWTELYGEAEAPPPEQPLVLASYVAGYERRAYVKYVAVGAALPDLPLYLDDEAHVPVPLEAAYAEAWRGSSADFRAVVEGREFPEE